MRTGGPAPETTQRSGLGGLLCVAGLVARLDWSLMYVYPDGMVDEREAGTAMTHEQLIAWAKAEGLPDAHIFGLAIGCPVHGPEHMDYDTEALEPYCQACETARLRAQHAAGGSQSGMPLQRRAYETTSWLAS